MNTTSTFGRFFVRISLPILISLGALSPAFALADTATSTLQRYWNSQNGVGQKIDALPTTAVQAVPMPILFGVKVSDLSSNFGDPRDGGARTHKGEDVMAKKGTPIVSPTAAVVLKVETGSSEGNTVYTANPGGETFVYMHLDHFGEGVQAGTVLSMGSLIGYVGNTGNASGGLDHLHFEIHNSSGAAIDPFPRLTAEFTLVQKISYVQNILGQASNPTTLANLLVQNFRSDFSGALAQNITVPIDIVSALALNTTNNTSSTVAVAKAVTSVGFTRDLKLGMSGSDVLLLQKMLNAHGYTVASAGAGSPGNETMYFGPATHAAVIKFQLAKQITPSVGYFGPITRGAFTLV